MSVNSFTRSQAMRYVPWVDVFISVYISFTGWPLTADYFIDGQLAVLVFIFSLWDPFTQWLSSSLRGLFKPVNYGDFMLIKTPIAAREYVHFFASSVCSGTIYLLPARILLTRIQDISCGLYPRYMNWAALSVGRIVGIGRENGRMSVYIDTL